MDETTKIKEFQDRGWFHRFAESTVSFFSAEYLLTKFRWANGGTAVFVRSLHVSGFLFAAVLILSNAIDPARTGPASWIELRTQLVDTAQWFGTLFAAAYVALYARFANQWAYLAGVYNQIKAAESRDNVNHSRIAEWQAGFLEDALDLHLLRKKMFRSIARVWLTNEEVRRCITSYTHDGRALELPRFSGHMTV